MKTSVWLCLLAVLLLAADRPEKGKPPLPLQTVPEIVAFAQKAEQEYRAAAGRDKLWGDPVTPPLLEARGELLYQDDFASLANWHHEGLGALSQPEPGVLELDCLDSRQGQAGCMAFCRTDFPDRIRIEYDLRLLTNRGLLITFIAFAARQSGLDALRDLPVRPGLFADYTHSETVRSYHLSLSRYNDRGEHTGVSNWRRNPGLLLMGQQADLCRQYGNWYHVAIVKQGGLLQLAVDGQWAGGFRDSEAIPEPLPDAGKIGFRAIGSEVRAQIRNFQVRRLEPAE